MRKAVFVSLLGTILISGRAFCESKADIYKKEAMEWIRLNENALDKISLEIWSHPEPAFTEYKSSKVLSDKLIAEGFKVESGMGGMPTAFVAIYGSGRPVIGFLVEYDALPGLSQEAGVTTKKPVTAGAAGHGCGHNLLGTAQVGAAMAVKSVMQKHNLPGTIKVFGCPGEEVLGGKVFMAKTGVFDGLDICLDWHPRDRTVVNLGSSLALNNFEVTFRGKTAHSSGTPWEGRSALDAVELMNVGVNFLREHIRPEARIHYVIPEGGKAPNVVPDYAKVWYFVRDKNRQGLDYLYGRVCKIVEGAALMTDTTYEIHMNTGVYNLLLNESLSGVLKKNMQLVGPPQFTEKEQEFAREMQKNIGKPQKGLNTKIDKFTDLDDPISGGSTDVGDVSWLAPTASFGVVCWPLAVPGHSWGIVSSDGSSVGLKGMSVASKIIAASAIDALTDPNVVEKAQAEFKEKTKDFVYKSAVPKEQKPPIPQ